MSGASRGIPVVVEEQACRRRAPADLDASGLMHLDSLFFENFKTAGRGSLDFVVGDALRKWTVLQAGARSTQTLAAAVIALLPARAAPRLQPHVSALLRDPSKPLRVEFVCVRHAVDDYGRAGRASGGRHFHPTPGLGSLARDELRHVERELPAEPLRRDSGNRARLVLAYGPTPLRSRHDSFDFRDPTHAFRRCSTLFAPRTPLTDALAFLALMNYRAHEVGRVRQQAFLQRLCAALSAMLDLQPEGSLRRGFPVEYVAARWSDRGFPYARAWPHLLPWERRLALVTIDIARHAYDAFPRGAAALSEPMVVLLDRVDAYCPPERLCSFVSALDALLPLAQFVVTCGKEASAGVPAALQAKELARPGAREPGRAGRPRLPARTALLIDVDSTLPNVALMQLSRHLKNQGMRVALVRPDVARRTKGAAAVFASCVFSFPSSLSKVEKLRAHFGDDLDVGGSGVDVKRRLPPEVEALAPDFSLYPELGDRAIGFLTRGCSARCAFCLVPTKEGKPRQVSDLDDLLQGRRNLILLDDNILSHPDGTRFLEQMLERDVAVNFNQTLDLRRMTAEHAGLLRRLRCSNIGFTRRNYYFSLNDSRQLDLVRRRYALLDVTARDNVAFVCMYGFDTTLAEDLERFQTLRSLPRAYVFAQRYRPIPGGPPPAMSGYFDDRADELLSALVKVVFTQNMKNMEVYYRWLCGEYARARGRIHAGLVDTLFRYNNKGSKGMFLQKLDAICRGGGPEEPQDLA